MLICLNENINALNSVLIVYKGDYILFTEKKPRSVFYDNVHGLSFLLFDFTHKRIKGVMIHRDEIFLKTFVAISQVKGGYSSIY